MTTLEQQYEAITSGAGIARLGGRLVVRVTGDDRVSFLHGMCSQDIKNLPAGAAAPALLLTEHAHVVAEFIVYAEADALLIEIERDAWPRARSHLEQFLVADDVEFEECGDLAVIDVEGPLAGSAVAAVAGEEAGALKEWRHFFAGATRIASVPRFGAPAFTLILDQSEADHLIKELADAGGQRPQINQAILEILRVEHGLAEAGVDTFEKTLALEARLERAISFNKGCYIGQETIERATARGGIKKRLCSLSINAAEAPPVNSAVTFEGKESGRLTSVVRSPKLGFIGLAILHYSAWSAGSRVTIKAADRSWEAVVRQSDDGADTS
ncbi:MAG: hypothetical protein ABSG46_16370, partial [Candidatus Binataceae bacterium]